MTRYAARMMWRLILCLSVVSTPLAAQDAVFTFRWEGANDYAMTGAMSFDADLIGRRLVREEDVSCFVIEGTKDGRSIGGWRLGLLGPDTSWRLFFDPGENQFVVEEQGIRMPQAWNMNGAGTDCGVPGFGFNLGNLGQDFCIDNAPIVPSRVSPTQPFPASRDDTYVFPRGSCHAPDLLSLLAPTRN